MTCWSSMILVLLSDALVERYNAENTLNLRNVHWTGLYQLIKKICELPSTSMLKPQFNPIQSDPFSLSRSSLDMRHPSIRIDPKTSRKYLVEWPQSQKASWPGFGHARSVMARFLWINGRPFLEKLKSNGGPQVEFTSASQKSWQCLTFESSLSSSNLKLPLLLHPSAAVFVFYNSVYSLDWYRHQ